MISRNLWAIVAVGACLFATALFGVVVHVLARENRHVAECVAGGEPEWKCWAEVHRR